MLSFFRRRMKVILWILTVVIIICFVPWGVGVRLRSRGSDARAVNAGELFGKPVSRGEYRDAYMATVANAKLAALPLSDEQARAMAWERLILLREARRMGIAVSDGELARTITSQFGGGGSFDSARYQALIRGVAQVDPETYEEWLRQNLMIRRMNELVRASAWLPDREMTRRFMDRETRYAIEYALAASANAKAPPPSAEEVEGYYRAHGREFVTPPTVKVRCLFFPWEPPGEEPAVTDDEIKAYYDGHGGDFAHGRRVRAREIVLTAVGAEKKKAREEAEKIVARLRRGESFAKLAKKYSRDKKTAASGGDLGLLEEGELPKEIAAEAFSLGKGEFSQPIETAGGYSILSVDEIQEPGTKPLDEVKESVRSKLLRERKERAGEEARDAAYRRAVDASLALVDNPDLDAVARERRIEVKDIGPFAAGDTVAEIGPNAAFSKAAFETEIGAASDIIEIPKKGYCIAVPREKTEEKAVPLEEARGRIVEALKERKAREAAHADAARMRAEVVRRMSETKDDFASACKKLSIKTELSLPFTSRGPVEGLGAEPGVAAAAAELKPGEVSPVLDVKKGSVFFALLSRKEPAEKETAEGMEQFRRLAQREEEMRVISDWNAWLHEQARKVDYLSAEAPPDMGAGADEE